MINIRCIRDFAELPALEAGWRRLLDQSPSRSFFLSWEWISAWVEVFGSRFQPRVLVAEEDGAVIAIAPLMLGEVHATGLSLRALLIIGQQVETQAEYLDCFGLAGREQDFMAAFGEYIFGPLHDEWDVVWWERVLDDSTTRAAWLRWLKDRGVQVRRTNEELSFYLRLGRDLDQILDDKSANFRYQYRQSLRRAEELGDLSYLQGGRDVPLDQAFQLLTDLNHQRWQEEANSFRTDDYREFHGRLAARCLQADSLWFDLMYADGKAIAARYDFIYDNKMWCFQGGWDPDHSECRLGTIMTGRAVEAAIGLGLTEYDFLGGDSEYKRRWSDARRVASDLEVFNKSTLIGRAWPVLRKTKRTVRRWLQGGSE